MSNHLVGTVLASAWSDLLGGKWLDAILQPFLSEMGGLWVAFITLGIMASLYIDSQDIINPTVVAILVGGLVVGYGPPVLSQIGILILALGVTLAGARLWLGGSSGGRRA
jgi:hypothetical protein